MISPSTCKALSHGGALKGASCAFNCLRVNRPLGLVGSGKQPTMAVFYDNDHV